jgi:hypothetical protein
VNAPLASAVADQAICPSEPGRGGPPEEARISVTFAFRSGSPVREFTTVPDTVDPASLAVFGEGVACKLSSKNSKCMGENILYALVL